LGRADSSIVLPANFLNPILIGQELASAYVIVDSAGAVVKVSNPTTVEIVP